VGETLFVALFVTVGVPVVVAVLVGVRVAVTVSVLVGVPVWVGLRVIVGESVTVGVLTGPAGLEGVLLLEEQLMTRIDIPKRSENIPTMRIFIEIASVRNGIGERRGKVFNFRHFMQGERGSL
jgi:hypothetical protein